MIIRLVMEGPGGELDSRTASDMVDAVRVLVEMVQDCGNLSSGDVFRVVIDEDAS